MPTGSVLLLPPRLLTRVYYGVRHHIFDSCVLREHEKTENVHTVLFLIN